MEKLLPCFTGCILLLLAEDVRQDLVNLVSRILADGLLLQLIARSGSQKLIGSSSGGAEVGQGGGGWGAWGKLIGSSSGGAEVGQGGGGWGAWGWRIDINMLRSLLRSFFHRVGLELGGDSKVVLIDIIA